jgi:hypothetical protein
MSQLLLFTGGVIEAVSANTANTVVQRDNNGQSDFVIVRATGKIMQEGVRDVKGKSVNASQAVDSSVEVYEVDASGGAVQLTLPPVATCAGREFELVKTDNSVNAASFKGNGAELINAANTNATTTQFATIKVRANQAGTQWYTR